jgi:C-terminal peptidase prc
VNIWILGLGLLATASSEGDGTQHLQCHDFAAIYESMNAQHIRFEWDAGLKRESLVTEALAAMPQQLHDLGYHFLGAHLERSPLKNVLANQAPQELCDSLSSSLYRAIFLKSYARLLDPYSDFYLAEEMNIRTSVVDGEFVGVGIGTDPVDQGLIVDYVVEGGPSDGKLMVGDIIFAVDGAKVAKLSELEIRHRIRGPKHTRVVFSLKREEKTLDVAVVRNTVVQTSVQAKMLDKNFLHIKVSRFFKQTPLEVEMALHQHRRTAKGVILDLRDNPGGLLQAARDLVDLFIGTGVVVYLRGSEFQEQVWAMSKGGFTEIPLIVVVNEGTASAAEIVAGALQDYHRALVVGRKTYGKGSVQNVYETQTALGTKYSGGFKVTTLFYYLPSGRNVESLEPDVWADSELMPLAKMQTPPKMPFRGPASISVHPVVQDSRWTPPPRIKAAVGAQASSVEDWSKAILQSLLAESTQP